MKNNATRTIRSEEITIDVRICAALAANRGGEVYLAAIAPDMELTVITLDEAPGILPCFEEDDACLNLPNTSLLLCYNPAQVLKMGGKHYRADFAPLGGADLRLVPCPVVAHTAPHRDGLLLEVNVLPCEGADLADPKPGIVGDLNGQERRVILLFQIVRQGLELIIGNRRDCQPVLAVLIEQLVAFLLLPDLDILHGVKGNEPLGEDRKPERSLHHRRELPHIALADGLDLRSVGIGASERQEIEEHLQMLRGHGFELPAADGELLDAPHSALIGHHRAVGEIAGLDFFLNPHTKNTCSRQRTRYSRMSFSWMKPSSSTPL